MVEKKKKKRGVTFSEGLHRRVYQPIVRPGKYSP